MNRHISEKMQIVGGFTPIDMKTGANNGDWVSLKSFGRCAVIVHKGVGTAGEDPTIVLQQATDVAGTGSKTLTFTRVDSKVGTVLTGIGTFTKNTQAAAGSYVDAVSGEAESLFVIDIKAEDLDIDGGFDCLRATIADVGTTVQIGAMLYLLHEPRFVTDPLPSAIAD